MCRARFLHGARRIGDAAHGETFDLGQNLSLLIEDGDIEGLHFAATLIFLPGADVAVQARGKGAIDAHLAVGDGQEEIVAMIVILRQVERGAGRHVEQRGMLAQGGDIGREFVIELNFRQALAFAEMQPAQRAPARPKYELAFLPGAILLVKQNLAPAAAGGDGGAIDRSRGM